MSEGSSAHTYRDGSGVRSSSSSSGDGGIVQVSDLEALVQAHSFVRDDQYDENHADDWKVRMSRRYYDSLYKEYAIIDLSKYKEKIFGLRWRTESEVISKKGDMTCGAKGCVSSSGNNNNNTVVSLATYELPFKYIERGERKLELVKLKLCQNCSFKLRRATGKLSTEHTDPADVYAASYKDSGGIGRSGESGTGICSESRMARKRPSSKDDDNDANSNNNEGCSCSDDDSESQKKLKKMKKKCRKKEKKKRHRTGKTERKKEREGKEA